MSDFNVDDKGLHVAKLGIAQKKRQKAAKYRAGLG
jgi:hypothetical protein